MDNYSIWNDQLLKTLDSYYQKILLFINELEILELVKKLEIDHIGLQFAANSLVDIVKEELLSLSINNKPLSSAIVNGRQIFIFELNNPLSFGTWRVKCIELPYPKASHLYSDGWEHIEFVIPSQASNIDELRDDFERLFPQLHIDDLKKKEWYSESFPMADVKQLPNPAIVLRKETNLAIKFHPRTIKEIVLSEGV